MNLNHLPTRRTNADHNSIIPSITPIQDEGDQSRPYVILTLFNAGLSSSSSSSTLFPPAFFLFFEVPPAGVPAPSPLTLPFTPVGVGACDGVVCVDGGVGDSYSSARPPQSKPPASRKPQARRAKKKERRKTYPSKPNRTPRKHPLRINNSSLSPRRRPAPAASSGPAKSNRKPSHPAPRRPG